MRLKSFLFIIVILSVGQAISAQVAVSNRRIVIAASTVLDGKGRVLRDTRIVIEGSKIIELIRRPARWSYDLRGLTGSLPWVDRRAST